LILGIKLAESRSCSVCGLLPDGKIIIAGGRSQDKAIKSTVIFDPIGETVTVCPEMNEERSSPAGAVLNGEFYVAGGENGTILQICERFVNGVWETLAPMTEARFNLALVAHKDSLYAMGGVGSDWNALSSIEQYSPGTDTWSVCPNPMETERSGWTESRCL
jgi:hypothetical protein